MSFSNKRKKNPPQCGFQKGHPNYILKVSEETKKKISEITKRRYANGEKFGFQKGNQFGKKGHPGLKGEKNPNWKGGTDFVKNIRDTTEYKEWRKAIWERDNFTCRKCGQKGNKLNSHHILSFTEYPEYKFNIDNGITLCRKCHKEFHRLYGIRYISKLQLKEFLQSYQ